MRSCSSRFMLLLVAFTCSCCSNGVPRAWAGECVEPTEHYVAQLETIARGGPPYRYSETFMCLKMLCEPPDWRRWAGPQAAQRFAGCRSEWLRERIAAACLPILADTTRTDNWCGPRVAAAEVAAAYGFSRLGPHDVFAILCDEVQTTAHSPSPVFWLLAITQDPRTLSFLTSFYESIAPSAPDRDDAITDVLNCLYHVPGDSALALAERIGRDVQNPTLHERARRVLER